MTLDNTLIYTDGSCLGNPGVGGWGAICVNDNSQKTIWKITGIDYQTTNNRMELTAIIKALQYFKSHEKKYSKKRVSLYSDSNLIIQTLNLGWKKKANLDLWNKLDEAKHGLVISFYWVKGHALNHWNNTCDRLAQNAARMAEKEIKKNPELLKQKIHNQINSSKNIQESLF